MSKAHLCDYCSERLPDDGEWFVLGIREPRPALETMIAFLGPREEPKVLEFCAPHCVIAYLWVAQAEAVR